MLDNGIVSPDMYDGSGNLWFFYASICYDGDIVRWCLRRPEGLIKVPEVIEEIFIGWKGRRVKTKSTREMIDYSWTWRKKRKKWIITVFNTIETFVDILDGTFEVRSLFVGEFGDCGIMPYKSLGKLSDILHLNDMNN